ncbi:tetratricopeptide repeat protein, partial [Aeromonas veronii]|uniref:tetratricopeptide repeat protein n=1 Tax=Aeromonas veronii TaxID=654 RepID=UPI003D246E83
QCSLGDMYLHGRGVQQSDQKAASWYRKSAEQGDAAGQCSLGDMYLHGRGVQQSDQKAASWYSKAAKQDEPEAQFKLGEMYRDGRGVLKNAYLAVSLFHKAAERGDAAAQYALGEMYRLDSGVRRSLQPDPSWDSEQILFWNRHALVEEKPDYAWNHEQKLFWYRQAAEQGHADAQFSLGVDEAFESCGLTYQRGENWLRLAAEQGHSAAQQTLGEMYFKGMGVQQDDQQAYAWSFVAAANGRDHTLRTCNIVAERLTPADLAQAQALAAHYVEQYQPK